MNIDRLKAAHAYEKALLELAKATDTAGCTVILLKPSAQQPPSSQHILGAIVDFYGFAEDEFTPLQQETYLRNLALLANAGAAAFAYERSLL